MRGVVRCAAVAQLVVHGAEEGGCHPPPPRWRTGLRKLVLHPARIVAGGAGFEPPCSASGGRFMIPAED